MFEREDNFAGNLAGAIDLLVDFATLGEYGLESRSARERCEQDGRRAGWEALAARRRGDCALPAVDFRGAIARFAA